MLDYGLSNQQLAVICALSSGATLTAAAEQAGVHRNTVSYWRRNFLPFQQALADAQYDRAMFFREKMEDLADAAFQTLRDILADPKAPAGVRLKAALAVVQTAATPPLPKKQVELDIEKVVIAPHPVAAVTEDQLGPAPHNLHNDAQPAPRFATADPGPITVVPPENLHKAAQTGRTERKIGRNELCPCGSGIKYKRCCLDKPLGKAA